MSRAPIPFPKRPPEPDIEWDDDYPRINPGVYPAYCFWAKKYRDPEFKRWTCILRWRVLAENLEDTIANCIPMWFRLGENEKPRASRRSDYLREWVKANGTAPTKGDGLSPKVFTRRIARVEIGDTKSPVPYSVVRKIIGWETGGTDQAPGPPRTL